MVAGTRGSWTGKVSLILIVELVAVCLAAVTILYFAAELFWYAGLGFDWLHRWGVSPAGIEVKAYLICGLCGVIALALILKRHRV